MVQNAGIRQRKTKRADDEHIEPLDESDQARLVRQLEADAAQQTETILRWFGYLCTTVCVVVILCTIYLHQWQHATTAALEQSLEVAAQVRPFSVCHGMLAAALHELTPRLARHNNVSLGARFGIILPLNVVAAVTTLWAARRVADETLLWAHYGIVASNVFGLCVALLLRWDSQATEKALEEVVQAQYRYKSL